jgi:hypothetical protein
VSTADLPDAPARADGDDGTRDLLLRALAGLQPPQRTIVVLRYIESVCGAWVATGSPSVVPAVPGGPEQPGLADQ